MAKAILVYDQQCMRFTRAHAVALGVAASMLAGAYLWSDKRQPETRVGVVVRPAQLTPPAVESAARQNPFAPVATEVVSLPKAAAQPPAARAVEPTVQSPSHASPMPEAPADLSPAQQHIDEAALQSLHELEAAAAQTVPLYEDSTQAAMQAQQAATSEQEALLGAQSIAVENQALPESESTQPTDPQGLIQQ